MKRLLMAVFLLLPLASLSASTFIVNPTDFTESDIQDIINDQLRSGDTLLFQNGTYSNMDFEIQPANDGVIIKSQNLHGAVIDGNFDGAKTSAFYNSGDADDINNVTIDGFEITQYQYAGVWINGNGGTTTNQDNWVVKNCKIHDMYRMGIYVQDVGNVIDNCEIYYVWNHEEAIGIWMEYTEQCVVKNCNVYFIKKECIRNKDGENDFIVNNVFHGSWAAIAYNEGTNGVRAYNNLIMQCCFGFYNKRNQGTNWTHFRHNTIKDMWGHCLHWGDNASPKLDYIYVNNNKFLTCMQTHVYINFDPANPTSGCLNDTVATRHVDFDGNAYCTDASNPDYYYLRTWVQSGTPLPASTSLAEFQVDTPECWQGRWESNGIEDTEANIEAMTSNPAVNCYDSIYPGGDSDNVYPAGQSAFGTQLGSTRATPDQYIYEETATCVIASHNSPEAVTNGWLTDRNWSTTWESNTPKAGCYLVFEVAADAEFTHTVIQPFQHYWSDNITQLDIQTSDVANTGPWTDVEMNYTPDGTGNLIIIPMGSTITDRWIKLTLDRNREDDEGAQTYGDDEYQFSDIMFWRIEDSGGGGGGTGNEVAENKNITYIYSHPDPFELASITIEIDQDGDAFGSIETTLTWVFSDHPKDSRLAIPIYDTLKGLEDDDYQIRSRVTYLSGLESDNSSTVDFTKDWNDAVAPSSTGFSVPDI